MAVNLYRRAGFVEHCTLDLSELPDLLGARPVRSHLVHALVELDRATSGTGSWEDAYAAGLLERFGSG